MALSAYAKAMYALRNANLQTLGFYSYKAYLKSPLWAQIKARYLPPDAPCFACGRTAITLHHNRYELDDLTGFCGDHLIPVCHGCHGAAEFNKKGVKIGPQQATGKLEQLREVHAVKAQQRDSWRFLFETMTHARVYLGMQDDYEAQDLATQLDEALGIVRALPRGKR